MSTAFKLVHLKNDMVYQKPSSAPAGARAGKSAPA